MSQDTLDLLKVLFAVALIFAAGTLTMLYAILLLSEYGANLPMVGSLPLTAPPELVPMLADGRLFSTLAAVHVTATGLALLLTSQTIDMALLITSKAAAVVITALLGFMGGHMVYLQITENTAFTVQALTPAIIALAGFLVLSTVLSVASLRALGNLRFVIGIGMILLGPVLLMWL